VSPLTNDVGMLGQPTHQVRPKGGAAEARSAVEEQPDGRGILQGGEVNGCSFESRVVTDHVMPR
jgi:hypothetical protein